MLSAALAQLVILPACSLKIEPMSMTKRQVVSMMDGVAGDQHDDDDDFT